MSERNVFQGDEAILVTGGAGFIGSAVVRYLVRNSKHTVITLDKLTYAGNRLNIAECLDNPRHIMVEGDISDRALVRSLLSRWDVGVILHLAAESHVDRSIDSPAEFVQTNVIGTFILLEEFRLHMKQAGGSASRQFRFCHVSTDEVFGSLGPSGTFTEESRYDPSSPYSATKASSDHLVRAWGRTYELPVIVTNCSNNYGPYQHPEKLIPLMILNGLAGEAMPIYGDGRNVRDWLYVEDHAEALYKVACVGYPGETYNIGARSERSNLEVVHTICGLLDEISPIDRSHLDLIQFVPDRPGHDLRYSIDPAKIERIVNWRPRQTFETGLRQTIGWYIENSEWILTTNSTRVRRGLGV